MPSRLHPKLHTFSLILTASGLLALLAGCPPIEPCELGLGTPTADAGADQNVQVGQSVTLNGNASTDPDGDTLTYQWQQTSGPAADLENPNGAMAGFVPQEDGVYVFTLSVSDGCNSDEQTVQISAFHEGTGRPLANAGLDFNVNEGGRSICLTGTQSADPNGSPLTFSWAQLSGSNVSLSNPFVAEVCFDAPDDVCGDQALVFELTVVNEDQLRDTDDVVVTVRDLDGACCMSDAECDDHRPCTEDRCDANAGSCVFPLIQCQEGQACDEMTGDCSDIDACRDVVCNDDGLFCNGVESCEDGACLSTGDPCSANQVCDEQSDECTTAPCETDADCNDGLFCNGAESCVAGECHDRTPPCASNDACATIEDGLIAKWNLDGDAFDATGNGHDGVVDGASPAADRLGNPTGAMAFDGNDYLSVPDDPAFTLGTAEFTLAAWVTRDAFGADGGSYLLAHSDGPGDTNKWILWLGSTGVSFVASQPGWVDLGSYGFVLDEWNHVAVRRQVDTLTAFVDGSAIGSAAFSLSIPNPSQPVTIGTAEFDRPNRFLQGALDEVRFYNRALSDAELQALAAEGDDGTPLCSRGGTSDENTDSCQPVCGGLFAYDFDDGTLQGWSPGMPPINPQFGGELDVTEPGNPGFAMAAFDTVGFGGSLYAQAPEEISGDLSGWTEVRWDERLPGGSVQRTTVLIVGATGTSYEGVTADQGTIDAGTWHERSIPLDFDSGLWSVKEGSGIDTFDEVISDVAGVYIQMDVTTSRFAPDSEALVDNVVFNPDCDQHCSANDNCDDGLFCNGAETCVDSFCQRGVDPCPPGDICDEESDSCPTPICTTDTDCDDNNPCTDDTCDGTTSECVFTNNTAACDDNDHCTENDACVDGVCAGTLIDCTDGETCVDGDCVQPCLIDPDCDDTLFCNGVETCVDGFCQDGAAPCAAGETCDEIADECTRSCGETDTICSSEWVTGTIDPVADQDAYTFTGQAEDVVFIQVNRTSGGLNPQIRLFPPDNGPREALAGDTTFNDHSRAALFEHPLAETGQYKILILDDGLNSTGDYILSLLNPSQALTSLQDPDGGPIAFGETRTGAIDPVADQDVYTFNGQAGQLVFIQASRTSGGLNPQIRLYPPSGLPREALRGDSTFNDHSIAALFEHPLAETGQYTVLILDDGLNSTGEYLLSLDVLP